MTTAVSDEATAQGHFIGEIHANVRELPEHPEDFTFFGK
jgi:hypothetical protein